MSKDDTGNVGFPTYMDEFEKKKDRREEDLNPIAYHPLLNVPVPKGVEYVNVDDPQFGSGWGDALTYHTGVAFFSGGVAGGTYGILQGLRQTAGLPHMKLRVNGILNACGRRGGMAARSLAAAVLSFHMIKKVVSLARGNDDNEPINFVGSAAAVGGLIGATHGVRSAAIGTVAGGVIGAVGLFGTQSLKKEQI
jgi:hypothetical protein